MDENNGLLLNNKVFIEKDKKVALLSYMQRWGKMTTHKSTQDIHNFLNHAQTAFGGNLLIEESKLYHCLLCIWNCVN